MSGGPQMIAVSRDGRRVYVTTSSSTTGITPFLLKAHPRPHSNARSSAWAATNSRRTVLPGTASSSKTLLDGGQLAKGRAQIQQALKRTQESPFIIFKQEVSLR